jgi:hypothetical protein
MLSGMRALLAILIVALTLAAPAVAAAHGFRDAGAPREAAAMLNARPDVDGVRCHWKVRGHTIGCLGTVQGLRTQMYLWSTGRHVMARACVAGACHTGRAHFTFGRPY